VFELCRARCNRLQALPVEITLVQTNLPSGYHRDLQVVKESIFPALQELKDCLRMLTWALPQLQVNTSILEDSKYAYLFSVEEVNRLVQEGLPFRDAYKHVGLSIEAGTFNPPKAATHTHQGSIGNLCNDAIAANLNAQMAVFKG
jgi:argininosuccinate lyase